MRSFRPNLFCLKSPKTFCEKSCNFNMPISALTTLKSVAIAAVFPPSICAQISMNGLNFSGDDELERANSRPLSKEDIIRNFRKTDGYPFLPEFADIKTEPHVPPPTSLPLRRTLNPSPFENFKLV